MEDKRVGPEKTSEVLLLTTETPPFFKVAERVESGTLRKPKMEPSLRVHIALVATTDRIRTSSPTLGCEPLA